MKANLPENKFFDSFYIWFNKEKREEYYSTPLYLYSVNRKDDFENRLLTLYFDKSEVKGRTKEEQGLKYPGNMYFPYVERFGMFLLRFLNANLETYESAYETFFFAYGFEILKDIDENYTFELKGKYENDEVYLKEMEIIYNELKYKIQEMQEEMKVFVNYVYNLNEQEELKEGIYKIVLATAPTQSLTVDGGKTFNGANIHIWNYVNSPQQQFKIKYDDEGYCEIIPVHSNKRIDVAGWGNEANVDQWEYNGRK